MRMFDTFAHIDSWPRLLEARMIVHNSKNQGETLEIGVHIV